MSLLSWANLIHPELPVETAAAKALFYYGAQSVADELSISGGFDAYFGCPVTAYVDAATDYMKSLVFNEADDLVSLIQRQMSFNFVGSERTDA